MNHLILYTRKKKNLPIICPHIKNKMGFNNISTLQTEVHFTLYYSLLNEESHWFYGHNNNLLSTLTSHSNSPTLYFLSPNIFAINIKVAFLSYYSYLYFSIGLISLFLPKLVVSFFSGTNLLLFVFSFLNWDSNIWVWPLMLLQFRFSVCFGRK